MKTFLNRFLAAICRIIPLPVYRLFIKRNLISFCYHAVGDHALPHLLLYPYKNSRQFEHDILYLRKNFRVVSYAEIGESLASKSASKQQAALLTFDDGLSQCFSIARPILKKHKTPCIFFISTSFIDNKRMSCEHKASLCMSRISKGSRLEANRWIREAGRIWEGNVKSRPGLFQRLKNPDFREEEKIDRLCGVLGVDIAAYLNEYRPYLSTEEVRILASEGFTIGAHGVTHRRLDLLSEAEAEKEIIESAQTIMDLTGVASVPFAFPYHGLFVNRDFLRRIKDTYKFIDLFFDTQYVRQDRDFVCNRVWVDRGGINAALRYAYMDSLRHYLKRSDCFAFDFTSSQKTWRAR